MPVTARIAFPINPAYAAALGEAAKLRSKVTMRQVDGSYVLTLPFAPVEVAHRDIGLAFEERPRPAIEPLLLPSARKLPKMTFELLIVDGNRPGLSSCEHILTILEAMATDGLPIVLAYGPMASKHNWIITDLQIASTQREPLTNHISKAQVQIELTKSSPLSVASVPGMPVILDTFGAVDKPSNTATKAPAAAKTRTTPKVENEADRLRARTPSAAPMPTVVNGEIMW